METRELAQADKLNANACTSLLNKNGTLELLQDLPSTMTSPLSLGTLPPSLTLAPGEDTVEVTRIVNSTNDQQGDQEDMPTTQFSQEPVHPITGRTEPSGGDKATAIGPTYDISDQLIIGDKTTITQSLTLPTEKMMILLARA